MAKAYKCDRCGELFERIFLPEIKVVACANVYRMKDTQYDLCPKCQEYLENWLNAFKKKENKFFKKFVKNT